jgi:hypothetical protein
MADFGEDNYEEEYLGEEYGDEEGGGSAGEEEGEFEYGGEEEIEEGSEKEYEMAEEETVFEEEREEMAEVNAYERAGGSLISSYSLKSARNPKEKFSIILSATLQKMASRDITENDKSTILHSVANREDIIYKNPAAYILGYIGSRGGRGITKGSMDTAFNNIGSTIGVEEPDVVRYSVFWVNMTRK